MAGGLTINYVDLDGHPVATATKITGDIGTTYTIVPLNITGYTCEQVGTGSAATSGTLGAAAGQITFIYAPDVVHATVTYYDTTTQQTLSSEDLMGTYGSATTYTPTATLAGYTSQGYQVTSDPFPATGLIFDQPDTTATYTIDLAHKTVTVTPTTAKSLLPAGWARTLDLSRFITETVAYQYPDGQSAATPTKQTALFTRNATVDLVTGTPTYGTWRTTGTDGFAAVTAPTVTGYTAATPELAAVTGLTATSPDVATTVHYVPDAETATVNYYLNGTTTPLAPSTELTGGYDTPYATSAPDIDGYALALAPSDAAGTFTTAPTTVDYYYVPVTSAPASAASTTPTSTLTSAAPTTTLATPTASATPTATTKTKPSKVATPKQKTKTAGKKQLTATKGKSLRKTPAKQLHLLKASHSATPAFHKLATSGQPVYNEHGEIIGTTRVGKPRTQSAFDKKTGLKRKAVGLTKAKVAPLAADHRLPQTDESQVGPTNVLGLLTLGLMGLLGQLGLRRKKL